MKHLCSLAAACCLALAVVNATPVPKKATTSPRDSIIKRLATSLPFLSHDSPRPELQRVNMPRAVSSTTKKRLQKRAVEAAPSSEENRVRHLYKAYETILNSESQLPMFLNHHEQPGSKKRTRKQE